MTNTRLHLVFAGETMVPPRAHLSARAWGPSRFPTPLPAHAPEHVA
jgi:hypothetical protein